MKGLLVVTTLIMAVVIMLPPGRSPEVNKMSNPQAAGLDLLSTIALVFMALRDLLYGIGEAAVKVSTGLWEVLPERLKPIVGILVLGNSLLALLGLLTLSGATRIWNKILN